MDRAGPVPAARAVDRTGPGSGPARSVDRGGAHVDVHVLFCHYNALYFHDSLGACAVSWSSSPLPSGTSTCHYYPGGGCEIVLSKPLLGNRPTANLKNTLLHEMIHAYMCFHYDIKDHSDHGPSFKAMMNSINSSTVTDPQRPVDGYNITIYHELHKEVESYRCEKCGILVKSTIHREPSVSGCPKNVGPDGFCDDSSCHWHRHKKLCSGCYVKVQKPAGCEEKRTSSKADHLLHESTCEELLMQKSSKAGGSNDRIDAKKTTSTSSLQSSGDGLGSSGNNNDNNNKNNSVKDNSQKNLKESNKAIESKGQSQEISKRTRTSSKKNSEYTAMKRRKLSKSKSDYAVIIQWLNVFAYEDEEEDEEPLVNKRTERRRKQKMLISLKNRAGNNYSEVEGNASPSHKDVSRDEKPENDSKPTVGDLLVGNEEVPLNSNTAHEEPPTKSQGNDIENQGEGECSSPINSPVRGEIVDISDG
ncbi:sprT-like domain-containing protein Spartan [Ananas comosus]|uniref:SprT-like domain-containing protein Spartan n=1 Tax=Ananas comosus TaxID=4615 RepID=A0A6P5GIL4_ANACO|nr:sprT-like domain-containing protein Spartan [Ananas comosus]